MLYKEKKNGRNLLPKKAVLKVIPSLMNKMIVKL